MSPECPPCSCLRDEADSLLRTVRAARLMPLQPRPKIRGGQPAFAQDEHSETNSFPFSSNAAMYDLTFQLCYASGDSTNMFVSSVFQFLNIVLQFPNP